MEVFTFKCPSCGGKISYKEDVQKWVCTYCKKSFDAVFAKEDEKIPDYSIKERTIYYHTCKKCKKEYTSFIGKDAGCIYCGEKNTSKESIIASAFATRWDVDMTNLFYTKTDLHGLPKELLDTYLDKKQPFMFEYVNCDLLDGLVELKYNNKTKKYLFVNLVVPNLRYEDYRFMYELGNTGFKAKTTMNDYGVVILETADKYKKYLINQNTNNPHIEGIINTCIETFKKENGIDDDSKITVNNHVKIKKGYYIPIWVKKVVVNDEVCVQRIVANKEFNTQLYLQYPKIENAIQKERIAKFFQALFTLILVFSFVFSILFINLGTDFYFMQDDWLFYSLLIGGIFSFIVSIIILVIASRKIALYSNSIVISKEKYYDQIVNNSNYVKILKGDKK